MAPSAVETYIGPPKVIGPATKTVTRPTNPLPQWLIDGAKIDKRDTFDPTKHIAAGYPSSITSMKDIGLEGHGISPNAVSAPFPLFTEEAVGQMRAEVFSEEVLADCQYASTFNKNMIRGMGPVRAPFTYDAWNSPEVLAKISQVAGVELVPALDHEIANVNVSAGTPKVEAVTDKDDPLDEFSAVAWHYDSYPFVCVTMLSDCEGMIGGETAVRTGTGEIMKVRGPAMGTAVVMQGRYIEHQALKALGGRERISMVTSFRPKSPTVKDETVLTGSRVISNKSDLYDQYTQYRLEVLEERIRSRLKQDRKRGIAKRRFDTPDARKWLTEQKDFLEAMLEELWE